MARSALTHIAATTALISACDVLARQTVVTPLQPVGGAVSIARGVNRAGVVVGVSADSAFKNPTPTIWINGVGTTLNGMTGDVAGINDAGQIAGTADLPGGRRAYLQNSASAQPLLLGPFPGAAATPPAVVDTSATGIGPDGSVYGSATTPFGRQAPCAWSPSGSIQDHSLEGFTNPLVTPGASRKATNAGQILGNEVFGLPVGRPMGFSLFRGSGKTIRRPLFFGTATTVVSDLTETISTDPFVGGDIVGEFFFTQDPRTALFFTWDSSGAYTVRQLPEAPQMLRHGALGINEARIIVGYGHVNTPGQFLSRALLWFSPVAAPIDLNTMLPAGSGWVLTEAIDITDNGMIVGNGEFQGIPTGFTMTLDSDGDGLLDFWESPGGGLDGDFDGVIDLRLADPPYNAKPDRKDLFVEIDSGGGARFPAQARSLLIAAFANAPVSNPDGSTGITLHIFDTQHNLSMASITPTSAALNQFPADANTLRDQFQGDPGDSDGKRAALRRTFRYALLYPRIDGGYSGLAEIGGDQLVLNASSLDNAPFNRTLAYAGVFMHELGHTLGLRHGGDDGVIGKPNYPSVMNYALSQPYPATARFWRLDYSRSALPTLNESDLDEAAGVLATDPLTRRFRTPFASNSPLQQSVGVVKLDGSTVDWNADGDAGEPTVSADINFFGSGIPIGVLQQPSPGQTFIGHDDWGSIVYAVSPGTSPTADGVGEVPPIDEEPGPAITEFVTANVPIPCDPYFEREAQDVIVSAGTAATLTVEAYSGSAAGGPVSFRWRRDGVALEDGARINGSRTPTLMILPAEVVDSGVYDCVVENACAANESLPALLDVVNDCLGDANFDGRVDMLDLGVVLANYGAGQPRAAPDPLIVRHIVPTNDRLTWAALRRAAPPLAPRGFGAIEGDLNRDGLVDFLDLNLVLALFGRLC